MAVDPSGAVVEGMAAVQDRGQDFFAAEAFGHLGTGILVEAILEAAVALEKIVEMRPGEGHTGKHYFLHMAELAGAGLAGAGTERLMGEK